MADAAKKKKSSNFVEKGKKGKMTKAEKEKQKKEEIERKAQEEETIRLQAIEDAKAKKREEATMAVEKIKIENEERRKRRAEMAEVQDFIDTISTQLKNLSMNRRNQARWARYMRCDGSPDPVNQKEINTYINLRVEDKTRNDSVSVLDDSLLDLSLIDELKQLLEESESGELSEREINLHHMTIEKLQKLISDKLDLATLQILCDATELADQETGNLQHIISKSHICLCVWGNIMKNPRVKSFEFQEIQFSFDIPKVLGLSDCAVRLLNTKFDHLSLTSKAILPRLKKKEIPPAVEESKPAVEEEVKEDADKPKEEPKEEDFIIPDVVINPTEAEVKNEDEQEAEEVLEDDYPDPPTPIPSEYEDFDEEDDVVDLRAYDVLGGIYHFNLLQLPPQPKVVGHWTITQLVEPPELTVLDYVADTSASHEEGKKEIKKDDKPLIGVHMLLPVNAVFLETPIVARWDYERKLWVTKDFTDQHLNEATRMLSFKISRFGTFCLLQDSHINMPFQSWEIRPHKMNSCLFTITAAILELEIEIQNGLCCLSQPKERQELSCIIDKWVTPEELIKMMKSAGVNIFPNEDSSKFVALQNRHPVTEDRLYHHMSLTASSIAYTWSKWNAERNYMEFVIQAAEALEDEPLLEESWGLYLATKRRVTKLRSTELDESSSQLTDQDNVTEVIASEKVTSTLDVIEESEDDVIFPLILDKQASPSVIPSRLAPDTDSSNLTLRSIPRGPSRSSLSISKIHRSKKTCSYMRASSTPDSISKGDVSSTHIKRKKNKLLDKGYVDPLLRMFDLKISPYRSNLYHLMMDYASKPAQDRIQESSLHFIDCVYQLLRATKVLTYS